MSFPIFRKLENDKNFYKIKSEVLFEELNVIGSKVFKTEIEAKQYPEKLRIAEMLDLSLPGIQEISEQEYESVRSRI